MKRLPLNFHQTFIPERSYIASLLKILSKEPFNGSDRDLSEKSGIPMGESSGKAPAILAYTKGMGLVRICSTSPRIIELSEVGKKILSEDPYLTEDLTLWLLHFGLTRLRYGADLWYQVFNQVPRSLGSEFNRDQLTSYLSRIYNCPTRSCIGPVLRTYTDDSALGRIKVINNSDADIRILTPPLLESYSYLYAYLLLSVWENSPDIQEDAQVTELSLNNSTEIFYQLNLNERQIKEFLDRIESIGAISIDKQMNPWVINKKKESLNILNSIYDLL